jgi:hypothetical protein
MKRSDDRILTTHIGSLPRGADLEDISIRKERGERMPEPEFRHIAQQGVEHVVSRQIESGVDVINDGEQPRVGFQSYTAARRASWAPHPHCLAPGCGHGRGGGRGNPFLAQVRCGRRGRLGRWRADSGHHPPEHNPRRAR